MRMSVFVVLAATLLLGACTTSKTGPQQIGAQAAFMPLGQSVEAPRGYTDMCNIRPQLCRDEAPARSAQTPAQQAQAPALQTQAQVAQPPALQAQAPVRRTEARPAATRPNLMQNAASAPTASVAGPQPRDSTLIQAAISHGRMLRAALPRAASAEPDSFGPNNGLSAETRLKLISRINRYVNSKVRAAADRQTYGVEELWNRPGVRNNASGDCEDFAIEKRAQLLEQGYPPEDLFFAVAYRSDIGLHAVLIAHTQRGDYVLDNRSPYVTPWTRVPYVWVKRQSSQDPQQWGRVDTESPPVRGRQMASYSPQGNDRDSTRPPRPPSHTT